MKIRRMELVLFVCAAMLCGGCGDDGHKISIIAEKGGKKLFVINGFANAQGVVTCSKIKKLYPIAEGLESFYPESVAASSSLYHGMVRMQMNGRCYPIRYDVLVVDPELYEKVLDEIDENSGMDVGAVKIVMTLKNGILDKALSWKPNEQDLKDLIRDIESEQKKHVNGFFGYEFGEQFTNGVARTKKELSKGGFYLARGLSPQHPLESITNSLENVDSCALLPLEGIRPEEMIDAYYHKPTGKILAFSAEEVWNAYEIDAKSFGERMRGLMSYVEEKTGVERVFVEDDGWVGGKIFVTNSFKHIEAQFWTKPVDYYDYARHQRICEYIINWWIVDMGLAKELGCLKK